MSDDFFRQVNNAHFVFSVDEIPPEHSEFIKQKWREIREYAEANKLTTDAFAIRQGTQFLDGIEHDSSDFDADDPKHKRILCVIAWFLEFMGIENIDPVMEEIEILYAHRTKDNYEEGED